VAILGASAKGWLVAVLEIVEGVMEGEVPGIELYHLLVIESQEVRAIAHWCVSLQVRLMARPIINAREVITISPKHNNNWL
jgi:hypothetical protein